MSHAVDTRGTSPSAVSSRFRPADMDGGGSSGTRLNSGWGGEGRSGVFLPRSSASISYTRRGAGPEVQARVQGRRAEGHSGGPVGPEVLLVRLSASVPHS